MATLDIRGAIVGQTAAAIKAPCVVATTGANITLSGVQTVNGVTVGNNNERVLVKDQTNQTQNGIYQAATGNWILTTDFSGAPPSVAYGTLVLVASGQINQGVLFEQICTDNPINIGTSLIQFTPLANNTAQSATSGSSATIGTGAMAFTVQAGKAFAANQWVIIYETTNPANAMLAQVTTYSGTSLAVNVTAIGGAGTYAAWSIVLTNSAAAAGIQPPVGSGNVTGPGSSTAGHVATFADASGKVLTDGGALIGAANTIKASMLAASAVALGFNMLNGQIVATAAAGALTLSIQTFAGATPSATDPVWFIFRSATAASGAVSLVEVTSALAVTVPANSTLGFSTNTPGRVWLVAVNSAGTVSLGVVNCLSGTSIFPLAGWDIASFTAFGAGANNAQILYAASSIASVPYSVLGYVAWEAPVTMTAGTWVAPSRLETYRPGLPLPGQVIQQQYAINSTTTTINGSNIQTATSVSITPSSSVNLISVSADFNYQTSGATGLNARLSRGTGPTYFGTQYTQNVSASLGFNGHVSGFDNPGTATSITYYVFGTQITGSGTYNNYGNSAIAATEIMV